jgi:hypothetical protein
VVGGVVVVVVVFVVDGGGGACADAVNTEPPIRNRIRIFFIV